MAMLGAGSKYIMNHNCSLGVRVHTAPRLHVGNQRSRSFQTSKYIQLDSSQPSKATYILCSFK